MHGLRWTWGGPAYYLAALLLSVVFWGLSDSDSWASAWNGVPLFPYRIALAVLQGLGPVAWILPAFGPITPLRILLCFIPVWTVWLFLVGSSALADAPGPLHLLFCVLWFFTGLPAAALAVT